MSAPFVRPSRPDGWYWNCCIQQIFQRILPVLGRPANGIEEAEIFRTAVTGDDGVTETPLHILGLLAQHSGLVGHSDTPKMEIGIKSFGIFSSKAAEKLLPVSLPPNIGADTVGLFQIQYNEITPFARTEGP